MKPTKLHRKPSKGSIKRAAKAPRSREPNKNELDFVRWYGRHNRLRSALYEPCTFHTIIGGYTPDWMLTDEDGNLTYVEVKGGYRLGSESASRKSFLCAREKFTTGSGIIFRWFRADGKGGYFEEYDNTAKEVRDYLAYLGIAYEGPGEEPTENYLDDYQSIQEFVSRQEAEARAKTTKKAKVSRDENQTVLAL